MPVNRVPDVFGVSVLQYVHPISEDDAIFCSTVITDLSHRKLALYERYGRYYCFDCMNHQLFGY